MGRGDTAYGALVSSLMPGFNDDRTWVGRVERDDVLSVNVREEVILRAAAGNVVVMIMIVLVPAGGVVVMIVRHTTGGSHNM